MAKRFKGRDILPQGPELNTVGPIDDVSSGPDTIAASFKLSVMNSELSSLLLAGQSYLAERDDDIINPQQAKELFNITTTEDISASKAAMIQAHQEHKAELQKVIDYGPDGFSMDAVNFTASLGGAMIDPIGILVGMGASKLTALGMGKLFANTLKASGVAAKSGSTALKASVAKSVGKMNLATDLVGNVAGNLATEGFIINPAREAELEEVNVFNSFAFAVATGVGFPLAVRGLHKSLGMMGRLFDRTVDLPEKELARAYDATETKMALGKKSNMTPDELEFMEYDNITRNSRMATIEELQEARDLGGLSRMANTDEFLEIRNKSGSSRMVTPEELQSIKDSAGFSRMAGPEDQLILRKASGGSRVITPEEAMSLKDEVGLGRMANSEELDSIRDGLFIEKQKVAKRIEQNLNSKKSDLYYRNELDSKQQLIEAAEELDPDELVNRNLDLEDEVTLKEDQEVLEGIDQRMNNKDYDLGKAMVGCFSGVS